MRQAVVKLGGSTASRAEMSVWIAALASSSLPIVIVPGGGPFADQVRAAQKRMGFSDVAAHAMAILAMDQFAQIILDRQQRLVAGAVAGRDRARCSRDGKVPVWLPSALAHPGSGHPGLLGHHLGFACGVDCRQARRRRRCC